MIKHIGQSRQTATNVTLIIPTIPERIGMLQEAIWSVGSQTLQGCNLLIGTDVDRSGPAQVRNRLAGLAQTEWMAFLDDDDILYPDYFESLVPLFDGADVVYGWCDEVGHVSNINRKFDSRLLRIGNFIPVTACVRTDTFRKVGGFPDGIAYEDWGLWLRILDAGGTFRCYERPLWAYRLHAGSRTHENHQKIMRGEIREA